MLAGLLVLPAGVKETETEQKSAALIHSTHGICHAAILTAFHRGCVDASR